MVGENRMLMMLYLSLHINSMNTALSLNKHLFTYPIPVFLLSMIFLKQQKHILFTYWQKNDSTVDFFMFLHDIFQMAYVKWSFHVMNFLCA